MMDAAEAAAWLRGLQDARTESEGATGIPWGLAPDDGDARRTSARADNIVAMPQARTTAQEEASARARALGPLPGPMKLLEELGNAKVLSASEVKQLREDLIDTYKVYATQTDWIITHTNRHKEPAYIWQTIADDEFETLADFALDMGRSNPQVAAAVRGLVRTGRAVKVTGILAPRAYLTITHYVEHGGFGL